MDARYGVATRDVRDSAPAAPPTAPEAHPATPTGPGPLDGLEEGVVVCDRSGVVRAANTAALGLLPLLRVGEVVDVARCDVLARAVREGEPAGFDDGFVSWVGSASIPSGLHTEEVGPALDALAAALADSPRTVGLLRGAYEGLPAPVG